MTRPVAASFEVEDLDGNVYNVRLLGAGDEAADRPRFAALMAIDLPGDVVDIFANSRTVYFDVSDTPVMALAPLLGGGD